MIHLLNGDALHEKLTVDGAIYIFREALCDGPVLYSGPDDLWSLRQSFMVTNYGADAKEYTERTMMEFEAFLSAAALAESIQLWFEWDLFCQVNLWYIVSRLRQYGITGKIHWIQPPGEAGWGGFGPAKSITGVEMVAWTHVLIPEALDYFEQLWSAYASTDPADWQIFSQAPPEPFSKLKPVLVAETDRRNGSVELHRLTDDLIRKYGKNGFVPAFREFCKDHGYYGFGDLQFKSLWDQRIPVSG